MPFHKKVGIKNMKSGEKVEIIGVKSRNSCAFSSTS